MLGYFGSSISFCCIKVVKYPMKHKEEKLTKAKYGEWQASLFGACFIAFGLGTIFASYFTQFSYFLIFIGILLHSWGMYKTHQRNK